MSTITNDEATIIADGVFANCLFLTSVDFPVCTSIGSNAFYYCSSLTEVSFPACKSIYSSAFTNCKNLSKVYLTSTSVASLLSISAFTSTPMSNSTYLGYFGSIYVPANLLNSYKTATRWSAYSSRFVAIE